MALKWLVSNLGGDHLPKVVTVMWSRYNHLFTADSHCKKFDVLPVLNMIDNSLLSSFDSRIVFPASIRFEPGESGSMVPPLEGCWKLNVDVSWCSEIFLVYWGR